MGYVMAYNQLTNKYLTNAYFVINKSSRAWEARGNLLGLSSCYTVPTVPALPTTLPRCFRKNNRLSDGLWLAQAHAMALVGVISDSSANNQLRSPYHSPYQQASSWTLPSFAYDDMGSRNVLPPPSPTNDIDLQPSQRGFRLTLTNSFIQPSQSLIL